MVIKQFLFGVQETIREWFLRWLFCNYVVSFTLGISNSRHLRHLIFCSFLLSKRNEPKKATRNECFRALCQKATSPAKESHSNACAQTRLTVWSRNASAFARCCMPFAIHPALTPPFREACAQLRPVLKGRRGFFRRNRVKIPNYKNQITNKFQILKHKIPKLLNSRKLGRNRTLGRICNPADNNKTVFGWCIGNHSWMVSTFGTI